MFSEWKNRRRDERESDFAPPSAYFTEEKRRQGKSKSQENKSKMSFQWTKGLGGISEGKQAPQPSSTTTPSPPQQKPPSPSCPQIIPQASPSNLNAVSAPVTAPPFIPQYLPPPPFYLPFPPPHPPPFAGPPHMPPHFPPQYLNQYLPQYPPQLQNQSQPQQPPQPVEHSEAQQQPPQSLDDILSFYRNSTWSLNSVCCVVSLYCECKYWPCLYWGNHRNNTVTAYWRN